MAKGGKVPNVSLEQLKALVDSIKAQQPNLKELDVRTLPTGDLRLETMAAKPPGTGAGSAAMQALAKFADEQRVRMVLSLAEKGYQPLERGPKTSSVERLREFYKRFGFVDNKGRKKDFTLSDSMYRDPPEEKAKGGKVALSAIEQLRQHLRDNPEFANWFGKSQAVDAHGNPLRVFHGTTKNFESFDPSLSDTHADMGKSLYFTDSPHDVSNNYAGEGQDLEGRIIKRAEDLAQENESPTTSWNQAYEAALHQANKEFRQNEGLVIPAYLRMENPVKIGGKDETFLDYEPQYDEDGEFTGDEKGSLVDFVLSLRNQAEGLEGHSRSVDPAINAIMEHAIDYGGIKSSDLFDILNKQENLSYIEDDAGKLASKEIVRQALQDAGYDGWIDRTPDLKWGTQSGRSKIMPHLEGTSHYGVFEPTQVKSAVGNQGTFDPKDPDITKARGGAVKFAKGGKVARTAMDELKEYANALAPQKGMFSTLDELVQQAPFEKGSADQWRGYLKPGRMLKREGMEFPLKKEELDYALDPALQWLGAPQKHLVEPDLSSLPKEKVLEAIRKHRSEFNLTVAATPMSMQDAFDQSIRLGNEKQGMGAEGRVLGADPQYGPNRDPRLSHQSPGSVYEESMTRLPGVVDHAQHFDPDTISHSRTSSHELVRDDHRAPSEKMRLVEEIQSDLHQDAAERMDKVYGSLDMITEDEAKRYAELGDRMHQLSSNDHLDTAESTAELNSVVAEMERITDEGAKRIPRRGYITPEELAEFRQLDDEMRNSSEDNGWSDEQAKAMRDRRYELAQRHEYGVPDAPFKDAADYGRLELKKQLLNAAHNDEDYLAITRPEHQIERYSLEGDDAAAMEHIYGKVYTSEMKKLAKQYGAEITEVEVPLGTATDARVENLRNLGIETGDDVHNYFGDGEQLLEDGVRSNGIDIPLESIESFARQLDPENTTNWRRDVQHLRTNAVPEQMEDPRYSGDIAQSWDDLVTNVAQLVEQQQGATTTVNKTFPAIKLTPEVRERIKKAGVSLWATGAGAAGLELLGHPDDASAEEVGHTTGGGFAEGGTVDASESMGDLVRASQALMASHQAPDPYRDPRLFDRFLNSYQGQWTGFDPSTGDISSMLDLTPTEPHNKYPEPAFRRHRGADPLVTANATFREPAISLGLRTLPEQLKTSFGGEGLSAHPSEALQHLNAIESKMLEKDQLDAPEGLAENLFSNAGVVASQLPVPGDLLSKGVAKLPTVARVALKAPAAVADFFGPTVHPTARTIAEGATAGTALGEGIGAWVDHRNRDDPWALAAAAVRKGQLPADLAFQLASKLKPQPQDAPPSEQADESPKGLLEPGNVEPFDRPILENDDGSYSTTSSLSIGTDKGEVLIPTVIDGRRLTKEQAIQHYRETGEHLGIFSSVEDADAYAEDLHQRQAKYIEDKEFADSF